MIITIIIAIIKLLRLLLLCGIHLWDLLGIWVFAGVAGLRADADRNAAPCPEWCAWLVPLQLKGAEFHAKP